jgi:exosortase/archaeosortase family protein
MTQTSHSRPVIGRLAVMLPAVFGGFYLCQNFARHGEMLASIGILHALGAHNVISAGSAGILVLPVHHEPFIAVITPSCSSLASVLAISCLAFLARSYPLRRRVVAMSAAVGSVVIGNILRIAGSIGVGLISGRSSLLLFHDWVGSIFGLAYTLFGYLIMLYILLPPEPDRPARRVVLRPHDEIVSNVVAAPQRG